MRSFGTHSSVGGAYWEQQAAKLPGLGLPVMDTHYNLVTLVDVDARHVVREARKLRVAHVQLSVDTNDFGKPFKP